MLARGDAEAPLLNRQGSDDEELCHHVHYSHRAGWLRALVLGANDGLVSVASLMLGGEVLPQPATRPPGVSMLRGH